MSRETNKLIALGQESNVGPLRDYEFAKSRTLAAHLEQHLGRQKGRPQVNLCGVLPDLVFVRVPDHSSVLCGSSDAGHAVIYMAAEAQRAHLIYLWHGHNGRMGRGQSAQFFRPAETARHNGPPHCPILCGEGWLAPYCTTSISLAEIWQFLLVYETGAMGQVIN